MTLERYGLSLARPADLLRRIAAQRRRLSSELQSLTAAASRRSLPELVALVADPRADRGKLIYAMQKEREFLELLGLVEELRPARAVEIGTAAGGSLFLLAHVARADARLISVDLPAGPFGGGYSPLRRPIYRRFARDRQSVTLIRADSHSPRTLRRVHRALSGQPVDFLFIDGDHTLGGVRGDFSAYSQFVRKGGLIALHDIVPGIDAANQVPEFWGECRSRFETREITDPIGSPGFGIGVVSWPGREDGSSE